MSPGLLRQLLVSISLLACGGEVSSTADSLPPDTRQVAETVSEIDAHEVDAIAMTGAIEGRWAMVETQTALVTAPLLGTLAQASTSYYLAELAAGEMTVTLCDWLTEDASKLATTRMGDGVLANLDPFVRTYTLTTSGAGFDFEVATGVALRGVALTDPASEAMPTESTDPRVIDQDLDGEPGITLVVQGMVTGTLYVAHRHVASLTGSLASDTRISGLTTWTTEQIIFGSDPALIAAQKPVAITHPDADKSHFVMIKVGDTDDCDAINLARAALFP